VLKKVVESVLGDPNTTQHGYVVDGVSNFLELDEPQIRKELGIDSSAVLRGQQNLPKADEDTLEDAQQATISRMESFRKAANNDYDGNMKAYAARVAALSFLSDSSTIVNSGIKAVGDFKALALNALMQIRHLKDARDAAAADLVAFREENRLTRGPNLPKWPKFFSVALIFFVLAVETAFNGTFFADRVFGGIVQGFTEAFVFALINVGFGYAAGRVATNLLHISRQRRVLGWIGLAILGAVLLVNNLLAAHYRSILTGDIDIMEATALAYASLVKAPFGILDGKSWQLMGIGLSAAFITAWKAWNMDDPYPGYGRLARAVEEKKLEFINNKASHIDSVTAAHDKTCKEIDASVKRLNNGLAEYQAVLANRGRFHDTYVAHLDQIERVGNSLLGAYKKKNREARKDDATPPCLNHKYEISRTNITKPTVDPDDVTRISEVVKTVTAQLQEQLKFVHEARVSTMTELAAVE
jgi:multisubunit Na+/H+ antiporter MnhB subunit